MKDAEFRALVQRLAETPPSGRERLLEHVNWIEANIDSADKAARGLAIHHAFAQHYDALDPVSDAELIEGANELFRSVNPDFKPKS